MVQLVVILGVFTAFLQKAGKADSTEKLIEDLRRQLMKNNYDYERSGESEQLTTQPPEELPVIRAQDLDMSGYLHDEYPIRRAEPIDDDVPEGLQEDLQRIDEPSSKLPSRRNFEARSKPTINVSHRDLHYNMDDNHQSNNRLMNKIDHTATGGGETTVQYKVLEIRGHSHRGKSGRRNAQYGSRRRFLQEEKPDHIAIVPLDEGPIPEFRLPRNRRQYMGDYEGSAEMNFPTIPPLPGIMGLPEHDPTPVVKRRFRAPEPDSRSSTSAEIDPTRNRLRNSLEDELVYITQ